MDTMSTESKNTVGELLKQARLRQRLSVAECAKRTHVATRFIEALEEEKWKLLPSESHRLGFLKLYARFLGVSTEEAVSLYNKAMNVQSQPPAPSTPPTGQPNAAAPAPKSGEQKPRIRTAPRPGWSPSSIPQLIGFSIVLLILAWVLYHTVSPRFFEQNALPWTKRRLGSEPRLTTTTRTQTLVHKIRLIAQEDCWMRLAANDILLYEGILRKGTIKEWSGPGPFQFKIGNVNAIVLQWNEQPVDVQAGARGNTNSFRIPPS